MLYRYSIDVKYCFCNVSEAALQKCSFKNGVLEISSKFTGEHLYRSAISIKLLSNFTEVILWHEFSPVNFLHIFRTPFSKDISGELLLNACRR